MTRAIKNYLCQVSNVTREQIFTHIQTKQQVTYVEKCIVAIVNENNVSVFLQYNKPVTKQHVITLLTPFDIKNIESISDDQCKDHCLYLTGFDYHVLYTGLKHYEIAFIAEVRKWVTVTPQFSTFDHFVQQHADRFCFLKQFHSEYYQQIMMNSANFTNVDV